MKRWILLLMAILLVACNEQNVVSEADRKRQNQVDMIVSSTLFEHALDEQASYHIRTDGSVAIKFDESVTPKQYTDVVELLRSNSDIRAVSASQMGAEVCPLRPPR